MKRRFPENSEKGVLTILSGRRRDFRVRGGQRGGLVLEFLESRVLLSGGWFENLYDEFHLNPGQQVCTDPEFSYYFNPFMNLQYRGEEEISLETMHWYISSDMEFTEEDHVGDSNAGWQAVTGQTLSGAYDSMHNYNPQAPDTPGTYYLMAKWYDQWSDPITLHVQEGEADVQITGVTLAEETLDWNEYIPVTVLATNNGTVDAYDTKIGAKILVGGYTLKTEYDYVPVIGPGETVGVPLHLKVHNPSYLGVYATEGSVVPQLEGYSKPDYKVWFNITDQLFPEGQADLTISMTISEGEYEPGSDVPVSVTVTNIGSDYAEPAWIPIYRSEDETVDPYEQYSQDRYLYRDGYTTWRTGWLAPGETWSHTDSVFVPYESGDYYFAAKVDGRLAGYVNVDNLVEESNENNNWTQTFTIIVPDRDSPTATLAHSFVDDGYAHTQQLNELGYLNVVFENTDTASINGDELQLTGDGAEGVYVTGTPTLVEEGIYQYQLAGSFGAGPVKVEFPENTFSNDAGKDNQAKEQSFHSIPAISPLKIDTTISELTWDSTKETFTFSGDIGLGIEPPAGEEFQPLITIAGSVNFDGNTIQMDGMVTPLIAGIDRPLFSGTFEYNIGSSVTSMLNEAAAQVPNEYTLAGTELKLTKMEFVIPEGKPMGHAQMELQGSIKVPDDFGGFELSITDPHKIIISAVNGVSISGGTLTLPDLDIFMFGGEIKMTARDMSVEYIAAVTNPTPPAEATPAALRFRGTVALPYFYNATADFTPDEEGNDSYIEITELGGVDWYGTLSVEDIAIVPGIWELQKARLGMTKDQDGNYVTVAEAKLLIPTGIEIGAELGFVNGTFNKVQLEVDQLNKPIGTTGAFLQKIMGRVDHVSEFDTNPISFGGGIGLTAGPQISIDLPDWLGMGDKIEGSLVSLDLEADLDENHLTGHGFIDIVNGLAYGNVNAELNWTEGFLAASMDFNALDGLIAANGTFRADSDMNISLAGAGTVTIPSTIPLWGGTELGSANVKMQYISDSKEDNDFIAGWGKILVSEYSTYYLTGGFRVNFDGTYSFLGAEDISKLAGGDNSQVVSALMSSSSESYDIASALASKTYTVAADTPWVLIGAEWDNDAAGVTLELTGPDGTVYTEADIANNDQIFIVEALSDPQKRVVYIHDPMAGEWTLTVPQSDSLDNLDFAGYQEAPSPEVSITAVEIDTRSEQVSIDYTVADADGDSEISLYYDADGQGGDGVLIAVQLVNQGDGEFTWDTSSITPGTYHVYALAQDEVNPPVVAYWAEPLNIEAPPPSVDVPVGEGLAQSVIFTDADGTEVTVKLSKGQATVSIAGNNVDTIEGKKGILVTGDNLSLAAVHLTSSNETTALTVTTKGGSIEGTTLGDLTGGSLGKLTGKLLDLAGDIDLTGSLGTMTIDDIAESSTITAAAAAKGFVLKADQIGSDVVFDLTGIVKQFSSTSYADGALIADEIGKVKITQGEFGADVQARLADISGIDATGDITGTLSAAGIIKKINSKSGSFTGSARAGVEITSLQALHLDGAILSAGDTIRKVNIKGDILDSYILAGYDIGANCAFDLPQSSGDDTLTGGDVLSVSAKGTFARSYVAAGTLPNAPLTNLLPYVDQNADDGGTIAKVKFGDVDYYDAEDYFGLFAATEVKPFKIGKELARPEGYFVV